MDVRDSLRPLALGVCILQTLHSMRTLYNNGILASVWPGWRLSALLEQARIPSESGLLWWGYDLRFGQGSQIAERALTNRASGPTTSHSAFNPA
jgi:hypothetical protein